VTEDAPSGQHSQTAREAAVEWPDERGWQQSSRIRQASPRMAAPVPCSNYYGPLDTEELPDATVVRDPTRVAGQLLPEQSGRGWRRKAQGPQTQSRSARRQRKAAAVSSTMDGTEAAEAKAPRSSPPTNGRLGPLSDRPQFRDQLSSEIGGAWSPPPPGRGGADGQYRVDGRRAWSRACTSWRRKDPCRRGARRGMSTTVAVPCGILSKRIHSP
jgi:hypothetical protein